jgi:hypothetical protein
MMKILEPLNSNSGDLSILETINDERFFNDISELKISGSQILREIKLERKFMKADKKKAIEEVKKSQSPVRPKVKVARKENPKILGKQSSPLTQYQSIKKRTLDLGAVPLNQENEQHYPVDIRQTIMGQKQ